MKKSTFTFIFTFALLLLVSCDYYDGKRPFDQNDTFWVCEETKVYFAVNHNGYSPYKSLGFFYEDDLMIHFYYEGDTIEIVDTVAMETTLVETGGGSANDTVIYGKCKISKKKLTVTVARSTLDSVKVGDVMLFERVNELPDWADMDTESEYLIRNKRGIS